MEKGKAGKCNDEDGARCDEEGGQHPLGEGPLRAVLSQVVVQVHDPAVEPAEEDGHQLLAVGGRGRLAYLVLVVEGGFDGLGGHSPLSAQSAQRVLESRFARAEADERPSHGVLGPAGQPARLGAAQLEPGGGAHQLVVLVIRGVVLEETVLQALRAPQPQGRRPPTVSRGERRSGQQLGGRIAGL